MTWLKIVIQTLTHLIGKKADKRDVERLRHDTIPAPATASPGQTIVVKAVDGNGRPIEWEARDVGGGSGSSGNSVFIVNVTGVYGYGGNTYSADKTYAEIVAAEERGEYVVVRVKIPLNEYQYYVVDATREWTNTVNAGFSAVSYQFTTAVFVEFSDDALYVDTDTQRYLPLAFGRANGTLQQIKGHEWVLADAPRVYSPSGKEYKIMVDDSGAISATEVT